MNGEFRVSRVVTAAFAVLVAIGIAALGYQAGVAHGLALQIPAGAAAAPMVPPYYWYRPWGFGFGFFPIFFFVLLWIALSRALFWGGRGRWRRGYCGDGPGSFDDWHRRAHERMNNPSSPANPGAA
jgi:hypothetical protein